MALLRRSGEDERGGLLAPLENANPLFGLRTEMDRLFDNFFAGFPFRPLQMLGMGENPMMPRVDVCETDNNYIIAAELPGLDIKDVEVVQSERVLTIKGEKKQELEEKRKDFHLSERHYGVFRRTFTLPDTVDADNIGAEFNKGVLTITLPKTERAAKTEKKIEVKAASTEAGMSGGQVTH